MGSSGNAASIRPSIPRSARERVVARDATGKKTRSKFYVDGELVGEMLWEKNGRATWGWGIRAGKKHGLSVEWYENGQPSFAEPYLRGLVHGVVRHWDEQGKLLLETRHVHGAGVDLWCDLHTRTLAEETRTRHGKLHGVLRRWNPDARSIYLEEQYFEGVEHGIFRQWNDSGRLCRGFPRYFIRGERTDRRAYVRAASIDSTLESASRADDDPRRPLPPEFVGQPVARERRSKR